MKLTKEHINKINKLNKEGKRLLEIARTLKVHPNTIKYHLSPEFRDYMREYNKQRYRKITDQQKKDYFEKKRAYQKEYHKRKYQTDENYRNKQIERAKKYQREKNSIQMKGGQKNE